MFGSYSARLNADNNSERSPCVPLGRMSGSLPRFFSRTDALVQQRHHAPALRGLLTEQHGEIDLTRAQHGRKIAGETFDHVQPHIGIARAHGLHECDT
jgi:hypothetical protein